MGIKLPVTSQLAQQLVYVDNKNKPINATVHWLFARGYPPAIGGLPSQIASNVGSGYMLWCLVGISMHIPGEQAYV